MIGSRRMARSAGIQLAASATVVSTRVTPAKVGRSVGDTPEHFMQRLRMEDRKFRIDGLDLLAHLHGDRGDRVVREE